MSQPKRYIACTFVHYNTDGKIGMTESRRVEDPYGEYVQWSDYIEVEKYKDKLLSDYAALAADKDIEIKVLKDEVDCVREENAALAAENERLKQPWVKILTESETWKALSEVTRLTAENERLRKAGDAMADDLRSCQMDDGNKLLVDWEAAKERRDAK